MPSAQEAFDAIESSARLMEVAMIATDPRWDEDSRSGDSQAYKAGGPGILAGALSTWHGEYGLEAWRYAQGALEDLVEMSLRFENKAFTLALEDAADRARIEVDRARRRARGAA
jgi:hypothetical protein